MNPYFNDPATVSDSSVSTKRCCVSRGRLARLGALGFVLGIAVGYFGLQLLKAGQ